MFAYESIFLTIIYQIYNLYIISYEAIIQFSRLPYPIEFSIEFLDTTLCRALYSKEPDFRSSDSIVRQEFSISY